MRIFRIYALFFVSLKKSDSSDNKHSKWNQNVRLIGDFMGITGWYGSLPNDKTDLISFMAK